MLQTFTLSEAAATAREAATYLSVASSAVKDAALHALAGRLIVETERVVEANAVDVSDGEAVGLGLLAALRLSGQDELRAEVAELLAGHGLPTELTGADPDAVVMATARDKKRVGEGPVPFVLVEGPGAIRPGCAVENGALVAAVRELAA